MISVTKTRLGKFMAMGVGRITSDPSYRTVKGDNKVCQFFLQSDVQKNGGSKNYDSYGVTVWGDDADYASNLEKNDKIFIVGECRKDEYWSNKNGKEEMNITAEMIIPANIGLTVLQLQMAMKSMADSSGKPAPDASKANDDGFYDYSSLNLPDEFKDIEPDI